MALRQREGRANLRRILIMSKVAVVYWSSTGNTEAMANAVVDGIREKGGEAVLHTCEDFDGSKVTEYDAIAFGCPAMGDEVLEDTEFEPMFDGCKDALKGKNIALFGSYGWEMANGCATEDPARKLVQTLYVKV